MLGRKKKEIVVPVWDREDEYQALKIATDEAQKKYLEYGGDSEETKSLLEEEWLKLKKLYEPLYAMREEWLREAGIHPKVEQRQKMTVYEKTTIGITAFGMIAPTLWEQKGVLWRGAKEHGQRLWNLCMKALKR